jgi:hypothetical protein
VGAFFIVTVFFFPDGIVGTLRKLRWRPAPSLSWSQTSPTRPRQLG